MQSVDMEPNKEERLEMLKQDFEKPFSPPVDIKELIPKDYPSLDTNVDEHEWYDVGATIASAADIVKNKTVLEYRRPMANHEKMPRMVTVGKAFQAIKRRDFLPAYLGAKADLDMPLPIGFGQTNSQPSTVKRMLEWLGPRPGEKVLDVGSGSGWTSALLAYLVGDNGTVLAVEKIPELVELGRNNCRRAGIKNVRFYNAGKEFGLAGFAPYDRILVSASATRIPESLVNQLKVGGAMVIPVHHSIFIVKRIGVEETELAEKPGFVFVPLVK